MSKRPRYDPHPDANQPEIVSGLRDCGYAVIDISKWCAVADLLVWGLDWDRQELVWRTLEVKIPGGKLTFEQRAFQEMYPGSVQVVESVEDGLDAFGR